MISILIELPVIWIIILDILAWFFFHMTISMLMMRVPDTWYDRPVPWFQPFEWENNGDIWQKIFHIRSWKKYLPDSSNFVKDAYNMTNIHGSDLESLKKIIIETKRAEHTHWLSIFPAFLFFIWNPLWAVGIMISYALVVNVPFIITQRYNRPRLVRLYHSMKARNRK